MQTRENELKLWIKKIIPSYEDVTITPLAGDASFRRYYRLHYHDNTRVIMDAPPQKEALEPFIRINQSLEQAGIKTPHIYEINLVEGFLLLDDLGDEVFLNALTPNTCGSLYQQALDTLLKMQACSTKDLPTFDNEHMLNEMALFKEWFLSGYLSVNLDSSEILLIDDCMHHLADSIIQQPQVFIHRDYHSRNLMVLAKDELGVIDFQDAMLGPISYDLVSLVKDCYVSWPRAQVISWASFFHASNSLLKNISLDDFIRDVDYCGLQRHLKVLGIFSRLYLRDGKTGYLKDLPLTLDYVLDVTEMYEELLPLHNFIKNRVVLP